MCVCVCVSARVRASVRACVCKTLQRAQYSIVLLEINGIPLLWVHRLSVCLPDEKIAFSPPLLVLSVFLCASTATISQNYCRASYSPGISWLMRKNRYRKPKYDPKISSIKVKVYRIIAAERCFTLWNSQLNILYLLTQDQWVMLKVSNASAEVTDRCASRIRSLSPTASTLLMIKNVQNLW